MNATSAAATEHAVRMGESTPIRGGFLEGAGITFSGVAFGRGAGIAGARRSNAPGSTPRTTAPAAIDSRTPASTSHDSPRKPALQLTPARVHTAARRRDQHHPQHEQAVWRVVKRLG